MRNAKKGRFWRNIEKKFRSRPLAVLIAGITVVGLIVVSSFLRGKRPDGPWLGFVYPDKSLSSPALSISAGELDIDWHQDSPDESVPSDGFAIKWMTCLQVPQPADFWFALRADDAARLFVDGKLLLGDWEEPKYVIMENMVSLKAGIHLIQVEYREISGNAAMSLEMHQNDAFGPLVLPDQLKFPGWVKDSFHSCEPIP